MDNVIQKVLQLSLMLTVFDDGVKSFDQFLAIFKGLCFPSVAIIEAVFKVFNCFHSDKRIRRVTNTTSIGYGSQYVNHFKMKTNIAVNIDGRLRW